MQFFDPEADLFIKERRLPHWSQADALCFITWRTIDSIPRKVLDGWLSERSDWLAKYGVIDSDQNWRQSLRKLPPLLQTEFHERFTSKWHDALDQCHGKCVLRSPLLSQIVAKSLRHFDGDRYDMSGFVVMPNHVHLLAAFPSEEAMLNQCESWKHFTAVAINRSLGVRGKFWQSDGFDHLVRSEASFNCFREYIKHNPAKSHLTPTEFAYYSKPPSK